MAINHKFKPEDMPEVRRIRTETIKSYRLMYKAYEKNDKISKAIILDVNWNKIGIDLDTTDKKTKDAIKNISDSISAFQTNVAKQLQDIMESAAIHHGNRAYETYFNYDQREQAHEMAVKYWERMCEKPKRKPKKSKSSNNAFKIQETDKSSSVRKSPTKPEAKSLPTDKQADKQNAVKSAAKTPEIPTTTAWTLVKGKGKSPRKSSAETPKTTHCQPKTPVPNSTITKYFKTVKSTRRQTPTLFDFSKETPAFRAPTKFDFSNHISMPSRFDFTNH